MDKATARNLIRICLEKMIVDNGKKYISFENLQSAISQTLKESEVRYASDINRSYEDSIVPTVSQLSEGYIKKEIINENFRFFKEV